MIPRYSLPEMSDVWSDQTRFATWLEVELLATEAWARAGVVPEVDAVACRDRKPIVDESFVARVGQREETTNHDVAAFVDVVQDAIGGTAGPWIHYGLTSSDVVDTSLCYVLVRSCGVLQCALEGLIDAVLVLAEEHRETPMVGRTHGIHAEPTTFGAKVSLWGLQLLRDRQRLIDATSAIAVGKLSGAVGTYSNIEPQVEEDVCRALGLTAVPATQVISRDRHAQYLMACASIGATLEMIATEIRHLQRTEVREVSEAFGKGQKGSSAMPHKRNPILSERLCGIARVLRGYVQPGLEDIALWHERDISHSSVERVILPDASIITHYALVKATTLLKSLEVNSRRMVSNLDASFGLVFSQPVLLGLVKAGATRDDAYRIVQRNALAAWENETAFRQLLEADPEVTAVMKSADLDAAFDLSRALRHAGRSVDEFKTQAGQRQN